MDEIREQEAKKEFEGVQVVKCPGCGADMAFDPELGALHCEYCDTVVKPEKRAADLSRDFLNEREEGEVDEGSSVYRCPNCGGETETQGFESTIECPFCGATNIVKAEKLKGLKPDSLLPFAVSREQALEAGKAWIKKRFYAPRKLKKNFAADKFKGIYAPSFLFSTSTFSSYVGRLGKHYTVRVRTSKGYRTEVRTRWFTVSGAIDKAYRDVVVEASAAIGQDEMNSVLPYDLDARESYKKDYLAGFAAERYSTSLDDSFETAKELIAPDIRRCILARYDYDVVGELNVDTRYDATRFNYTLLPLWLCGYTYRKKRYRFLVNGRTGKSAGKSPVSVVKVIVTVLLALGLIGLLVWLFGFSGLV